MSSKKKTATKKVESITEERPEPEPAEELPVRQIEESPIEPTPELVEQPAEPVAETAPIVDVVAEPEKSAEAESLPVVEVVAEPAPTVEPTAEVKPTPVVEPAPNQPVKPKPLTMASLHAEIEELRKIVDGQAVSIKQLLEAPVRQRKPPTSNGKVQIKDTLTGKIYPSKNNVYQSLLKAGELKSLVNAIVFGSDPAHNSFGCYNLFRAYPGRFVEVKPADVT